jgi:SAM-dependent methyltransferase
VHCAEEIAHVLRPGGRFCFSEFSHRDFRFGSGREIEPRTFMRGTGVRTHYFDEGEVRDLFPSFEVELLEEKHWILRIRGKEYPRAEIRAVLVNPDG